MKLSIIVVSLIVLVIPPTLADTVHRKAHDTHQGKLVDPNPWKFREAKVKNDIVARFGSDFADPIVKRLQLYTPNLEPSEWKGYDYVFSLEAMAEGPQVLQQHEDVFEDVEQDTGVDREFVNAIMNIETMWGKGRMWGPVVLALYTLSVKHPNRIAKGWPETQLLDWLLICQRNHWDPFEMKGSRTGAFGIVQTEPGTYLAYGCRYAKDGKPSDPYDERDAICTAANLLKANGFKKDRWKAVMRYNHDRNYTAAVFDYAELMKGLRWKKRYRVKMPSMISLELAAMIK